MTDIAIQTHELGKSYQLGLHQTGNLRGFAKKRADSVSVDLTGE